MTASLTCFPATGVMTPVLDEAEVGSIPPRMLDARLVTGWRHFGTRFFRYNFAFHEGRLCGVLPLRLRLEGFGPSKSQRRVLRRNADLEVRVIPSAHGADYDRMFDGHRGRFTENVPDSLRNFLSDTPATVPCQNLAVEVRREGRLVAVSFLDVGEEATSSVYAIFDPAESARSLGKFTLLHEIEFARGLGKRFHYLGYAYTVPSVYDYKKRFAGVESYDWGRCWVPLPADFRWSREVEVVVEP